VQIEVKLDLMRGATAPEGGHNCEAFAWHGRRGRKEIHRATDEAAFVSRSGDLTDKHQSVGVLELTNEVTNLRVRWCKEDEPLLLKCQSTIPCNNLVGNSMLNVLEQLIKPV